MSLEIRSLRLRDERFGNQWFDEVEDHWEYADFKSHEQWCKGWISMDSAAYNPDDDRVYLGITSFAADIFKAYDRKSGEFVDLGYAKIADPFDAKFHRALQRGPDGCLYAAIALLHDVDNHFAAPGGAIVKYDPASGELVKLGVPEAHVYVQATAMDSSRERIYCQCFPPEKILCFNIRTRETRDYGLIGIGIDGPAQGENLVLDDNGCMWCGWQVTRAWQSAAGVDAARLCKLDPEADKLVFFRHGLPRPDGTYGTVRVESFFNFHDGVIYASGANGSLYRIDPKTAEAEYLFTPVSERRSRLAAMVLAADGYAYGVTGRDGDCELLRFDFKNEKYELLGKIVDQEGQALWQVHDICQAADGTLYACENDNPYRSGYLWEIRVL